MKAKRQKKNHDQSRLNKPAQSTRLPFIEHLLELRKRIFYIALSVIAWSAGAYFIQQHLVAFLLRPAHRQQFIYTSVGGGIDFLFRVCLYAGIALSIPVIVFQILRYLQPLLKKDAARFIATASLASALLALAGVFFGYNVGLPAALHFLLHQFTTSQIHPLLTIQSYISFVTMYLLGSALLFQLPLVLISINRIKPLKPKKLLAGERWVILVAFVGGGIMNPSPRVQDQLLLAGPIIATYQIGILLVWLINRRGVRRNHVAELLNKDVVARAERLSRFQQAQAEVRQKRAVLEGASASTTVSLAISSPGSTDLRAGFSNAGDSAEAEPEIFGGDPRLAGKFHARERSPGVEKPVSGIRATSSAPKKQLRDIQMLSPAKRVQPHAATSAARAALHRPQHYSNDFSMRRPVRPMRSPLPPEIETA